MAIVIKDESDSEELVIPNSPSSNKVFLQPADDKTRISPNDWNTQLRSCLSNPLLGAPLAYFETGISKTNPGLLVHGVGNIGLPLSTRDAELIIGVCEKSASNDGESHTWELCAENFAIRNQPQWEIVISEAVEKASRGLKIPTDSKNLRADLRKLLVFEQGLGPVPFPRPVVTSGSVATLAVYLPSEHQGGEIICSFNDHKKQLDISTCSDFESSILTWYTDASTQIRELTAGFQCVLLYDLSSIQQGPLVSAQLVTTIAQELNSLIEAWTKPRNHDLFRGPLLYLLKTNCEREETRLDHLMGRDESLVSTLRDICANSNVEVYLASVRKEVRGLPHDKDEDENYEWKDSENNSPELQKMVCAEEKYELSSLFALDGTELAQYSSAARGNFLGDNPFEGEPVAESVYSETMTGWKRSWQAARNVWKGTAVVLIPKHERVKFAVENNLSNAQTFLKEDIEDFEKHSADSTAARENLFNTCKVYTEGYSNAFDHHSGITWGTSYFSEVALGLLLKALPLVGMNPSDLLETLTPRAGERWGYSSNSSSEGQVATVLKPWASLNSNRIMLLATVVKACGFKEAEEKLTRGVESIGLLGLRWRFLDLFGSLYAQQEPHDQADLTAWVESLFSKSLAECEIDWAKDFDVITAACNRNSDQCVTTICEKLQKWTFRINAISRLVDAGLKGTIPKETAFKILRDVLSTNSRICLGDAGLKDIPEDAALGILSYAHSRIDFGGHWFRGLDKQTLQKTQNLERLRRDEQEHLAMLLVKCFSAGLLQELGQLVTGIVAEAKTKTKEELIVLYLRFLKLVYLDLREGHNDTWKDNTDLQILYRSIVKQLIKLHIKDAGEVARHKTLQMAKDLKKLLPEPMLREFLGKEVFMLRRKLYRIGAPTPEPTPSPESSPAPEPISQDKPNPPRKPASSGPSGQGVSQKRSLPQQSPGNSASKRRK